MFTHDNTNGKHPQARCFEDNPGATFHAAKQTAKSNYSYGAFKTPADFLKSYASKAFTPDTHIYETIKDNTPVKLFLDIDSPNEVDIDEVLTIITRQAVISGFHFNIKDVLIDTSHKKDKFSYHLIGNGRDRFENMAHLKAFMVEMEDELSPHNIDKSVYTKNRLFRLHGSSKHGTERYMGDEDDVTRTKAGSPNADYLRFLEARLVTSLQGHLHTVSMPEELLTKTRPGNNCDKPDGMDVMEKFLSSSPEEDWSLNSIIQRSDGTEYRMDRINPTYCEGCERTHDRRNGYIFVGDGTGAAYLKCYASTKSTYLFQVRAAQYQEEQAIEMDDETSDDEEEVEQTINEIRNEMAKIDRRSFKQFGKVHTYNKEYCSMHAPLMESTASIIANKCAMGGGKTNAAATRVIKLKAQTKAAGQKDWRTVVISFRISLTGTYKLKFKGFTAYGDVEGRIGDDIGELIIQPESMSRMKWSNRKPFRLVIDEAHQIIKQLTSSTYISQPKAQDSFKQFKWLVKNAGQIELMDANLTAADVKFFADMRSGKSDRTTTQDPEPVVETFINTYDRFKDWTYATCEKGEALVKALAEIKEGKRVYISSNRGVDGISAIAEMMRLECQVLEISSATIGTDEVIAAMANPNKTWGKYQAVIVSPSIQSGVSYDGHDFDSIYGIFGNRTNSSGDAAQMLYRIRNPKNKRVVVEVVHNNNNIGSGYQSSIYRGLELRSQFYRADMLSKLSDGYELDARGVKALTKNDFMQLYLSNTAATNRDYFNYSDNLRTHHIANGFQIDTCEAQDEEEVINMANVIRKMTKTIKRNRAANISIASDICQQKIKEICEQLKQGKSVDPKRVDELKKANILDVYQFDSIDLEELTAEEKVDWYLVYGDPKTRAQYRNLRTLSLGFDESTAHVKQKELAVRKDELLSVHNPEQDIGQNARAMQLSVYAIKTKPIFHKWTTVVSWLKLLGFESVWDTQLIKTRRIMRRVNRIRNDVNDIKELGHILEKSPSRMKGISHEATDQGTIKFMNGTLKSMFGVSIKGNRKKEPSKYGLVVDTFPRYKNEDEPHWPWIDEQYEFRGNPNESDSEDSEDVDELDSDDEDAVNPFL